MRGYEYGECGLFTSVVFLYFSLFGYRDLQVFEIRQWTH